MLCSGLIKYSTTWSVTSVAAAAANLNVMFLLWLKLSATHILLPQQPNLNVIERKFKRQILMPDPIILDPEAQNSEPRYGVVWVCWHEVTYFHAVTASPAHCWLRAYEWETNNQIYIFFVWVRLNQYDTAVKYTFTTGIHASDIKQF